MSAESHYNRKYFESRRESFEFSGWANLTKFSPYIRPADDVLDFGCSGGYLLDNITCRSKYGVEINPIPREIARSKGYEVVERLHQLPDQCVDVVVSHHALEHTLHPFDELRSMHSKLRKGGKIIIVVPSESVNIPYRSQDPDNHLFTWSPMNLGNLLSAAGFNVIESKPYLHKWPPRIHIHLAKIGGRPLFDAVCKIYGHLSIFMSQIRALGTRLE